MSKALWFVVRDIPHREHGEGCEGFPPLQEVKERLRKEIQEVAAQPLRQRGTHFGPQPRAEAGEADPAKLKILVREWP